jgi:hypothetical protein
VMEAGAENTQMHPFGLQALQHLHHRGTGSHQFDASGVKADGRGSGVAVV